MKCSRRSLFKRQCKEEPEHLHTDVFWLLSLLGISFTPLDFSSICFLTTEQRQGEELAENQGLFKKKTKQQ